MIYHCMRALLVSRKDLCRNAKDTNEKFTTLVGCFDLNIIRGLFEIVSRCCYFDPEICAKAAHIEELQFLTLMFYNMATMIDIMKQ